MAEKPRFRVYKRSITPVLINQPKGTITEGKTYHYLVFEPLNHVAEYVMREILHPDMIHGKFGIVQIF